MSSGFVVRAYRHNAEVREANLANVLTERCEISVCTQLEIPFGGLCLLLTNIMNDLNKFGQNCDYT